MHPQISHLASPTRTNAMNRTFTLRILLALALAAACGDDDRMRLDGGPDAGMDTNPPDSMTPDGSDSDSVDTVSPTVVGTDPVDGSEDAMPRPIDIFFSESMDAAAGSVTLTVDGAATDSPSSWSEDDQRLRIDAALPVESAIEVTLDGFTDRAGNPLPTFMLAFTTADVTAPYVVSSTPEEGDTGVDPALSEIRFELSEALATSSGAVALVGGPGTATFTLEESAIVVSVSGLAAATAYELVLSGFADGAGNALDPVRTLGDGALDFTTGADEVDPFVVASSPAEGQVDVTIGLSSVLVTFSEAMDTSVGSAVLSGGADSRALTPSWREGGTVARFALADLLSVDTSYSLTLVGFVDMAGNPLDTATYLVDGAVDFLTGDDLFSPYVVGTAPLDGATGVPYLTNFVTVAFSEVMDTSVDTVTFTSARGTTMVTGTWMVSATSITFPVGDMLVAGQSYSVDLSGFSDSGGSPLDTTHVYLGDGVLEFTTVAATGERCRDELSVVDATETSPGVYQWMIADNAVSTIDGTTSCDVETSPDAVIRFTKTSATSVLRIQSSSSDEMVMQVLEGLCDSRAAGADAARRRCLNNSLEFGANIEGPPGDYFIWVARTITLSFEPTTVTIEEVAAAPEGETCASPLTTSASRYYTAPVASGDPHVWTIPMDGVYGYDRGIEEDDASDFTCVTQRGADAVVRVDKTTSSSILRLEIESEGAVYEILDGACDPLAAEAVSLSCAPAATTTETRFVTGPARSVYVWAAGQARGLFDGAITVRAREIEPGPGESCGTAFPLLEGANAVTPIGTQRIDAPACTAGAVTWYRFTATTDLAFVTGNGFVPIGVVDAASATDVRCASDPTAGIPAFITAGRDYCVAVSSGGATTSLTLESVDYPGVTGNTVTDLMIMPFDTGSTFDGPFDPAEWMAVTPTQIYLASDGRRLVRAPRGGGEVATQVVDGFALIGDGGVAVGEAVFGLDDSSSAANRLYRYVDPAGLASTMPWDAGSTWVGAGVDAIAYDGTSLLMASSSSSSFPVTFYSANPDVAGPVTELGHNDTLGDVSGMAADAEWFYMAATVGGTEGIYRLRRSDVGNPAAMVEELPVGGLSLNHSDDNAGIVFQPPSAPGGHSVLYFRTYGGSDVYAILDPGAALPRFLGIITTLGRSNSDYVLALDPTTPALFITEEETDIVAPRFVRLE